MTSKQVLVPGLTKEQAVDAVAEFLSKPDSWQVELVPESGGTFTLKAERFEEEEYDAPSDQADMDSGDDEP